MKVAREQSVRKQPGRQDTGFSILEMVLASAVLMVGIISVVQLVPASLKNSVGNRMDTMATVIAQRELDQMIAQLQAAPPALGLNTNSFNDTNGNVVDLGGPNAPGAAVTMYGQSTLIDFSQPLPPAGFYISPYVDPNDPTQTQFELRWAVYPQTNASGITVGKRIIIGCRRLQSEGNNELLLPVTLDTAVWK